MPKRQTPPTGAPCWIQLSTSDPARSRAFYTALFGWEAGEASDKYGGYFMFTKDGAPIAGGVPSQAGRAGQSDLWAIYLASDDAEKTVALTQEHGGAVVVPSMPIDDLGTMAFVSDPAGAAIGIWQPGEHRGFLEYGEPLTPAWFELHTRDYAGALDFYRQVFGWSTRTEADTSDFRYSTLVYDDEQLAGVMDATAFLPDGVPAQWSVYFGVDDADATLAKAVELGASVVRPAEDTPFGRLATAADSTGAQFKLVAPNESMPARPSAG